MIWVEILSRHRDVTARFRINARELSIGRSYDNDVVVDDPYVAARHVKVFHDEAGQLVVEDLGSANGLYLDRGRNRLTRIVVDGNVPIRIGHSFIRIRETSHAVEQEWLVKSGRHAVPVVAALVLGVLLLGIDATTTWFSQTGESHLSNYLLPALVLVGAALVWIGMWSLLSRLFSGQAHFLRHVLIAETLVLAFWLYSEFAQFAAFSFSWPVAFDFLYIANWVVLAALCFLHLREVGRTHLLAKGIVVALLLVAAVTVQTLQRSEAFANSGRQTASHVLLPPRLRLAPLRDEAALFADIGKLRAKVDADRAQARPAADITSQ